MEGKRIYTFDIVKGLAILFLIPLHALIYKIGKNDPALFKPLLSGIPPHFVYFLVPVIILALWGPIFTLITGANIAYGFLRVYRRDPNDTSAYILRRILSAVLLILISRTAVFIFEGRMFANGTFNLFNFKIRYYADTLDSIALTNVIVPIFMLSIINRLKSRKAKAADGTEHSGIRPYSIYLGLALITLIWFVFTPIVHAFKPIIQSHDWKLIHLMYSKMTAGRFRFFPILGFGYVGAIIGTAIHYKENFNLLRKAAGIFFLASLCAFVGWRIFTNRPIGNIASNDVHIMLQVLNLGAMTFALVLLLGRYDYCRPGRQKKRVDRTLFIRRFSIVSLSIYIMESFLAHGVYLVFEKFWEAAVTYIDQTPVLIWNLTQILVFIFADFIIWVVIVRLWEKIDFMFSIEWLTLKVSSLFLGQKNKRINSHQILYSQ